MVENFRVEDGIGGRKPGIFNVKNSIDSDGLSTQSYFSPIIPPLPLQAFESVVYF